jgi:hypothetical protein
MKKMIFLLVLLSNFGFSQYKEKAELKLDFNLKTNYFNQKPLFQPIDFNAISLVENKKVLSLIKINGTFCESYIVVSNQFYKTNQQKPLNFLEDRKDSFNPFGKTNLGTTLGLGILNFLLEKN